MLVEESKLVKAGRAILRLGPKYVIIKKGEHGVLLVSREGIFPLPAYPLEYFQDPTGAGDTFAGGFFGYLAHTNEIQFATLKQATLYGSIVASFVVEEFGLGCLEQLSLQDVEHRCAEFLEMIHVEGSPVS